jgi:hypothetical protein
VSVYIALQRALFMSEESRFMANWHLAPAASGMNAAFSLLN